MSRYAACLHHMVERDKHAQALEAILSEAYIRPSCSEFPYCVYGQVLMFGNTADLQRTEAALRSAHDADMPDRCTRSIYLVDRKW